jgi:hypothetical protein
MHNGGMGQENTALCRPPCIHRGKQLSPRDEPRIRRSPCVPRDCCPLGAASGGDGRREDARGSVGIGFLFCVVASARSVRSSTCVSVNVLSISLQPDL